MLGPHFDLFYLSPVQVAQLVHGIAAVKDLILVRQIHAERDRLKEHRVVGIQGAGVEYVFG